MYDDLDDPIYKKEEYLKNWLNTFENIQDIVPYVRQAYDIVKWEKDVFSEKPQHIPNPDEIMVKYYNDGFVNLQNSLPQLPNIKKDEMYILVPLSSASSSITLGYVNSFDIPVDDNESIGWRKTCNKCYIEIQNKIDLRGKVESLLLRLDNELKEDFMLLENSYFTSKPGPQKDVNASIAMRNILEHYKGRLWQKVKRTGDKRFQWEIFVARLSAQPVGSFDYNILLKQCEIYKKLHDKLTEMAKHNKKYGTVNYDINELHSEFLTHIYTFLSLIKLLSCFPKQIRSRKCQRIN